MPFITGSFGENFRSFDLDSRAEACPISNDGSSIATYLSNTFQIFSINNLLYLRFMSDFQIHDDYDVDGADKSQDGPITK